MGGEGGRREGNGNAVVRLLQGISMEDIKTL